PGVQPASATTELSAYLGHGVLTDRTFAAISEKCRNISTLLRRRKTLTALSPEERRVLRSDLYLTSEAIGKLVKTKNLPDPVEQQRAAELKAQIDHVTKFIPTWVKVAVAFTLGLGTTIGWKRIVITVGEKIGKQHLTYAQGAAAELVAAGTILAADNF